MNIGMAEKKMEEAAMKSGIMLLSKQSEVRKIKSRKDFLTDCDLLSEEIILKALQVEFPGIPTLTEESGGSECQEGYLWVIDPIDGTINYFMQDYHWGVSIALVKDGQAVAGVVYLPAEKKIFCASRQSGIAKYRNLGTANPLWIKISVNKQNVMRESHFWIGWGKEENNGRDHQRVISIIETLDRHSLYPQIRMSATADLMAVAEGKITGFVFPKPDCFDIAAAGLIVELAGGKVTDLEGNPWSPFSRSFAASNGLIHEELLQLLR